MRFAQTWRWFGPNDPVSLQDVKQTGATGIVTALHQIPHGEVWTTDEIKKRKEIIQAAGLSWDVVESVTVHESIKTGAADANKYMDAYKDTLRNLAAENIKIVTYNFMPVNDWTRTNLDYIMPDGSKALYFNWSDLAVFDLYILQRKNAENDYPAHILEEAARKKQQYSSVQLDQLAAVVMFGIPGEAKITVEKMREKLATYEGFTRTDLQNSLKYFLQQIVPVADELGIQLAIHPDDPPFDILGLPRIVNKQEDYDFILGEVPGSSNGVCFCTGSLGANPNNDLVDMAQKIGDKVHFIHLRNTKRDEFGNFFEDDHLAGDTDMHAVMKELLKIQQRKSAPIPFRPDHGHQMMDDLQKTTNPGYSCIGRMRGLAELRGLELGICKENGW